jgi:hypothetical protein
VKGAREQEPVEAVASGVEHRNEGPVIKQRQLLCFVQHILLQQVHGRANADHRQHHRRQVEHRLAARLRRFVRLRFGFSRAWLFAHTACSWLDIRFSPSI